MALKCSVQLAGTSLRGPTMLAIVKFRKGTLGGQYKSLPKPGERANSTSAHYYVQHICSISI